MNWSVVFLSNPFPHEGPSPRQYKLEGSDATFELRDYLTGGRYPYEELSREMERAYKAGLNVYLYSVPGFLMVSAGHYGKQKKPWCVGVAYGGKRMRCFRTAAEAIRD